MAPKLDKNTVVGGVVMLAGLYLAFWGFKKAF